MLNTYTSRKMDGRLTVYTPSPEGNGLRIDINGQEDYVQTILGYMDKTCGPTNIAAELVYEIRAFNI